MKERWLLLWDPPQAAAVNMNKDLAIHRSVAAGRTPPTLRLYSWAPPAISLGFFQQAERWIDLKACQERGVEVVHRPTGGRAVVHFDDLTYSLALSESHPLVEGKGVVETYRLIAGCLVNALQQLQVQATLAGEAETGSLPKSGACFDAPSVYEIQVNGKKVAGSAQLRKQGAILQHGSILFRLPPAKYSRLLKTENIGKKTTPQRDLLQENAAGLLDLGYALTQKKLGTALVMSFARNFDVTFKSPGPLTFQ